MVRGHLRRGRAADLDGGDVTVDEGPEYTTGDYGTPVPGCTYCVIAGNDLRRAMRRADVEAACNHHRTLQATQRWATPSIEDLRSRLDELSAEVDYVGLAGHTLRRACLDAGLPGNTGVDRLIEHHRANAAMAAAAVPIAALMMIRDECTDNVEPDTRIESLARRGLRDEREILKDYGEVEGHPLSFIGGLRTATRGRRMTEHEARLCVTYGRCGECCGPLARVPNVAQQVRVSGDDYFLNWQSHLECVWCGLKP